MQGAELDRLITEYHAAVKSYRAVSRLIGLHGAEFDSAYKEAEAAFRRAALPTLDDNFSRTHRIGSTCHPYLRIFGALPLGR